MSILILHVKCAPGFEMIFTFLLITSQSQFYTVDVVVAVVAVSVSTNTRIFYFIVKAALNGTLTW